MISTEVSLIKLCHLQGFQHLTSVDFWPGPKTIGTVDSLWAVYDPSMRMTKNCVIELSCLQASWTSLFCRMSETHTKFLHETAFKKCDHRPFLEPMSSIFCGAQNCTVCSPSILHPVIRLDALGVKCHITLHSSSYTNRLWWNWQVSDLRWYLGIATVLMEVPKRR